MDNNDTSRQLLRHTLATLAYRAGKALRGAPDSFAAFSSGEKGRAPEQILAHMGDLMDWGVSIAKGKEEWHNSKPSPWASEIERFFGALQAFDDYLASNLPLAGSSERLFQGPVADALTHTGQIAMLRRMAGCPIHAENYSRAKISAGSAGLAQGAADQEFD